MIFIKCFVKYTAEEVLLNLGGKPSKVVQGQDTQNKVRIQEVIIMVPKDRVRFHFYVIEKQ